MPTRRSHPLRTLLIVLTTLVVLLVVADRVGDAVAEHVAADRIRSAQHLSSTPSVDIDGFPFLTQLAAAHYDHVTVSADGVVLGHGDRQVRLTGLTTDLRDVDTSRSFDRVHAGSLTATGTATLAQVGAALGQQLSYGGDGRVRLTESTTVLGNRIAVTVSSKPVVRDGELAFTALRVDSGGSTVQSLTGRLASGFDVTVPLTDIPFGLQPRSVSVSADGVRFALSGSDVTLAG